MGRRKHYSIYNQVSLNVLPFLSKHKLKWNLREMEFSTEAYSECCQTSKNERFTKIVDGFELLFLQNALS